MNSKIVASLAPIVDNHTKTLILGSIPGVKSLQKEQYYANPRNQFWKIIAKIFDDKEPISYAEQIALLQDYHLGLWDVIHSCERVGSLDSTISEEVPNNFISFFEQYPSIKNVGFNGSQAYLTFKKLVGFHLFPEIQFVKLPSTSPTPGKNVKSFEEKIIDWEKFVEKSEPL